MTAARPLPFIDLQQQQQVIRDSLRRRMDRVLEHGQYIMGPEVAELEECLAHYTGVKHCIAVSDGTTALMIALMALGIGPGDEVITTPFTFIATAEVTLLLGAKPVFVDIDCQTCNMEASRIEEKITPRTKAIMPVSLFGQCADMAAINRVAETYRLPVIEDGAQSFGAMYHGRRSCGLTTIGCTSFFPSKPLGCYGDGGACFTGDEELARRMRQIRLHGQESRYLHAVIGLNGRMDTLQAAILLAKFEVFPGELERRTAIASRYTELLRDVVATPVIVEGNTCVYAQYTIQVDDRETLRNGLFRTGIPTAVHYPLPLHLQPAIQAACRAGTAAASYPAAETMAQRVLSIPMSPYLQAGDQDRIVAAIRDLVLRPDMRAAR